MTTPNPAGQRQRQRELLDGQIRDAEALDAMARAELTRAQERTSKVAAQADRAAKDLAALRTLRASLN